MHLFLQQLINGLSIGAVYALLALGYTMVYGVLRLINFAHGDVYMVGAVVAWVLADKFQKMGLPIGLNLALVFLGSAIACAILGFAIERLAYRPLRQRPRLVSLITAIGVSLLLENLFQQQQIFGPTPRLFPALFQIRTAISFSVGGEPIGISNLDLICFGLTLSLMLVLSYVVLRTRTGLALRAVSHRFDTASLMGIDTDRIISITFVLGSVLASVASVLDAIRYDVNPTMGLLPGLKAFVAAVIGGIGSIPGAVVGGLLMGVLEAFLRGMILSPRYSGYADAVFFLLLVVILLVRPSGLLGRHVTEKV